MEKKIILLFLCLLFTSCSVDDNQKQPANDPITQEDSKLPKSIGEYVLGTEITSKKGIYAVQGDSLNRIDIMYKYAQYNQTLAYGNYLSPNEIEQRVVISKTTSIISQHGINFLQNKLRFYPIISNKGGKMILSSCAFNYDNGTNNITVQNDNWKGWDRIYLDFSNKEYITQWLVYSGSSLPKASWSAYHIFYYY